MKKNNWLVKDKGEIIEILSINKKKTFGIFENQSQNGREVTIWINSVNGGERNEITIRQRDLLDLLEQENLNY